MDNLPDDLRQLYEQARAGAAEAYAPYSGFRVGAAIRTADGTVFRGGNIENASFSLTICAERVACVQAVRAGSREFDAIAVYVDGDSGEPCGPCRQFLAEFSPHMTVVFRHRGAVVTAPLSELLPQRFEPAALDEGA